MCSGRNSRTSAYTAGRRDGGSVEQADQGRSVESRSLLGAIWRRIRRLRWTVGGHAMSLRISKVVERCPGDGTNHRVRVRLGEKCVVVEDVVLHRWRQRSHDALHGERFDGCRLRPNTWRALRVAVEMGLSLTQPFTREALAASLAVVRGRDRRLVATQVDKLLPVLGYLQSRRVLQEIVMRERPEDNPGVPDLFLWRYDRSGVMCGGRFVEVKRQTVKPRWRESLSPGQTAELAFLRSLRLKAERVWLIERPR